MSRPSKLSPAKIARLRALRDPARKGGALSLRRAAAELGVSHETLRTWDTKHRVKAKASTTTRVRKAGKRAADVAAELVVSPLPDAHNANALEQVRARSAMVGRLLKKLAPAVEREEFSATSFVTLAKYGDDLSRLLAELAPPAAKDPNEDADVLEAELALIARLEALVFEAQHLEAAE